MSTEKTHFFLFLFFTLLGMKTLRKCTFQKRKSLIISHLGAARPGPEAVSP